jgi:hypothetical protein
MKRMIVVSVPAIALLFALGGVGTASAAEGEPPADHGWVLTVGHANQGGDEGVHLGAEWDRDTLPSGHFEVMEREHFDGLGWYSRWRLGMGFGPEPSARFNWNLIELGLRWDTYTVENSHTNNSESGYYVATDAEQWWGEWGSRGRLEYNDIGVKSGVDVRLEGLYDIPRVDFMQARLTYDIVGSMRERDNIIGAGLRLSW